MNINYSVKGEGRNIILLHGWGGSIDSLEAVQSELSMEGLKVYNMDLPGFGGSDLIKETMGLDDYIGFLRNFILELDIKKPVLVGHSFGGKLAASYTARYRKDVSKLVLINASGINPRKEFKKEVLGTVSKTFSRVFRLPVLKWFEPIVKKLFYKVIVRESDYLNAGNLKETFKKVVNTHIENRLKLIEVPSLLIWGAKDTYTPLWQGKAMDRLMPNSRMTVIADATHGLPLNQPVVVAHLINSFI